MNEVLPTISRYLKKSVFPFRYLVNDSVLCSQLIQERR
jgi:hypothetical protein